jgi:hypothetical protein
VGRRNCDPCPEDPTMELDLRGLIAAALVGAAGFLLVVV